MYFYTIKEWFLISLTPTGALLLASGSATDSSLAIALDNFYISKFLSVKSLAAVAPVTGDGEFLY